jgi:hypothetical protein
MSSNQGDSAPSKKHETAAPEPLAELVHSTTADLKAVASDPRLSEDLALALLNRRDLDGAVLEALASNPGLMKLRRVLVAVTAHPKTPRYVALPISGWLYTFELMKAAQSPTLASDLKISIEETILGRLSTVSAGERLTLAKQGSTRIAGALLNDSETRVMQAALANPRLTEAAVVNAILRHDAKQGLVQTVSADPKWSVRREVQVALLRNALTPFAKVLQFAKMLPKPLLRDILQNSRLPVKVKSYLATELDEQK